MTANAEKKYIKLGIEGLETNSDPPVENSNPAAPTFFHANRDRKHTFLNIILPVTVASDSKKGKRLINLNGFPYRPAELVKHSGQYVIQYYIWDTGERKLKRRRVLKDELAKRPTHTQLINYANEVIEEINSQLHIGGYQVTEPKKVTLNSYSFDKYSLLDAIDYVIKLKRTVERIKPGSLREYNQFKSSIERYMTGENFANSFKLTNVNGNFVNGYLHFLTETEQLSNKTHNNRLGIFNSVINTLMRLDNNLFKRTGSPTRSAKNLKPGPVHKHPAYTENQMNELKEKMAAAGKDHLWIYIQFMFYTLARPNELRHIKVGHISMDRRQILIYGDDSKTNIEEYVGISDSFAKLINESGILDAPPEYYVFSNLHTRPGPLPAGSSYPYSE